MGSRLSCTRRAGVWKRERGKENVEIQLKAQLCSLSISVAQFGPIKTDKPQNIFYSISMKYRNAGNFNRLKIGRTYTIY